MTEAIVRARRSPATLLRRTLIDTRRERPLERLADRSPSPARPVSRMQDCAAYRVLKTLYAQRSFNERVRSHPDKHISFSLFHTRD
ncbi:hypothetical protein [Burkholderia mayonis]|uniref:hypothetical protein n=1 Tax=Burkholderia mayonis TaxID=1385591 RepID=UPI001939711D|nr:hypothetical protein [Burkholderia mayonis]